MAILYAVTSCCCCHRCFCCCCCCCCSASSAPPATIPLPLLAPLSESILSPSGVDDELDDNCSCCCCCLIGFFMYLLSYHNNPNIPIAIPPNMARRSNMASPIGDLPAKASLAAVSADSQAWL